MPNVAKPTIPTNRPDVAQQRDGGETQAPRLSEAPRGAQRKPPRERGEAAAPAAAQGPRHAAKGARIPSEGPRTASEGGRRASSVIPNPVPAVTFPEALPVSGRREEIARGIGG